MRGEALPSMLIQPKTRLSVDIGPLMEMQWTGIPVFTRRVVQSLLMRDDVALDFAYDLVKVPAELVEAAIRSNSGGMLRDGYERHVAEQGRIVDPRQPIFYPTVKRHMGAVQREASTVHDLSALFMPENHEVANVDFHMEHLRDELASDEVVFCASQATVEALTLAYPSTRGKARVLYQYADWPEEFAAIDDNLPPLGLGRYAVVIGTLEPRKNLAILLEALSLPAVRESGLRFVVIGRKGWKVDAFLAQLTAEDRSRLIFSGFVTEFVKFRLLRHSEFLVFPSVYEGFGIPALEAMLLGKPVLASMTSSFPEVIGPAGVYFDPRSPEDFAAGFQRLIQPSTQAELAPEARRHAALFNPRRMGEDLLRWAREQ